jgi:hypothetical protein
MGERARAGMQRMGTAPPEAVACVEEHQPRRQRVDVASNEHGKSVGSGDERDTGSPASSSERQRSSGRRSLRASRWATPDYSGVESRGGGAAKTEGLRF